MKWNRFLKHIKKKKISIFQLFFTTAHTDTNYLLEAIKLKLKTIL